MNEQQCKSQKKPRGIDREGGREGGEVLNLNFFHQKYRTQKLLSQRLLTLPVDCWQKLYFSPKEPD